jgi:hypothetical protein
VAHSLNDEIRRLSILVDEFDRPFHPDPLGDFQGRADAEWIGNRATLGGHNDTPCGRPTPAGLSAAQGLPALRACLVI